MPEKIYCPKKCENGENAVFVHTHTGYCKNRRAFCMGGVYNVKQQPCTGENSLAQGCCFDATQK